MSRGRHGASPEGGHAGGIFRSAAPGTTVSLGRPAGTAVPPEGRLLSGVAEEPGGLRPPVGDQGLGRGQLQFELVVIVAGTFGEHARGPADRGLERLHAAAAAQNRAGSVIETQALRALALAASGEEAGAVDVLAGCSPSLARRAMPECSPTRVRRWARCWADWSRPRRQYRPPRAACLHPVWPGSCGSSARSLLGPDSCRHAMAAPGLVEQLTARELEILVLLAARMPNPRIAQELVVSLDTVKKHVSHLLGKLGAANAPRPPPGPAARPDPLTGRPRPRAALSCHVPPGNVPPLSTPPGDALPWLWFLPCSVTAPHRRVGTGPSGETLMSQARSVTPRTVSRSSPARSSCWAATRPSPPPCSPSPPSNSPYRPSCRPEGSGCSAPLLRTGPSQRRLVPPRFQVLPAKTSC